MYQDFFNFTEPPFAIVPNPKFFFLSERHKEALSHMLSGISGGGGMALLTGEVGTGKTMTMRALLARLPTKTQVLTIVNPSLNEIELLQTICDGFELSYNESDSFKTLLDLITKRLYENEAKGIDSILLVDEAQHLTEEVLELLRLLTNIETANFKLLKVILIGQPELHQVLQKENLRQLAQRITERYQLLPLPEDELKQYILHRLTCTGRLDPLFQDDCYRVFANYTGGVPRLINLVCDQALKVAYREGTRYITAEMAKQACQHILNWQLPATVVVKKTFIKKEYKPYLIGAVGAISLIFIVSTLVWSIRSSLQSETSLSVDPVVVTQNIDNVQQVKSPQIIIEPQESDEKSAVDALIESPVTNQDEGIALDKVESVDLQALAMQSASLPSAVQNLYNQWGYIANDQALNCQRGTRANLSCYRGDISLDHLENINRPVILVMNSNGQGWYARLYSVNEDNVELLSTDNQRIALSRDLLVQHWSGESILLWRPPFGNTSMLSLGQSNSRVGWLIERLNMATGEFVEPRNRFDQSVRNQVIAFQVQHNLDADGIAGPLTMMMLDGVLGLAGPTLEKNIVLNEQEKVHLANQQVVLRPEISASQITLRPLPLPVSTKQSLPYVTAAPKTTASQAKTPVAEKPANSAALALGNEKMDIKNLDFSSLSPELAKRVENALIEVAETPQNTQVATPSTDNQTYSNVVKIENLPANILARLPAMDFQAHVYASNPNNRWVKVNNRNIVEGEIIAGNVLLRGVEPQQIVVQFENQLIAIPALSTW